MFLPFGLGISNILAVGTLVWNVYKAYEGAPEQFQNFSKKILPPMLSLEKLKTS